MPALSFGGHEFRVVDRAALFWPARSALIVADLHLEKASWFALHGQMLPPHESRATLDRLAQCIATSGAREVWCLGDNFHDDAGADRMTADARAVLLDLTTQCDWHWIVGNHDAHLPPLVGGRILDQASVDGLILRHRAEPAETRPELSGHFHPKYRAVARARGVSRPCFMLSETKLILPAFGALTGGLRADHIEIRAAIGVGATALVASGAHLLRFKT
jgi:uncharacterized protein